MPNLSENEDRVLSVMQPWASLLVAGGKRIETRSWSTNHRGRLWVHASGRISRPVRDAVAACPYLRRAIAAAGFASLAELPLGAILGSVEVVDSLPIEAGFLARRPWSQIESEEFRLGDYGPGRYGWFCRRPITLPAPVPATGRLGIWRLPPAIRKNLEEFCQGQALPAQGLALGTPKNALKQGAFAIEARR